MGFGFKPPGLGPDFPFPWDRSWGIWEWLDLAGAEALCQQQVITRKPAKPKCQPIGKGGLPA